MKFCFRSDKANTLWEICPEFEQGFQNWRNVSSFRSMQRQKWNRSSFSRKKLSSVLSEWRNFLSKTENLYVWPRMWISLRESRYMYN